MPKRKKLTRFYLKADDDTLSVWQLLIMRVPPLFAGLLLGTVLSFVTSRFEEVLATNIHLAFFIPFIVYMADAVGTQTQSIYARDMSSEKAKFSSYLLKELLLGIVFGGILGIISFITTVLWLHSFPIASAVGLSMFCATGTAPLIAVVITELFSEWHEDPAVAAGPIATVIQDTLSILVYGLISSALLL